MSAAEGARRVTVGLVDDLDDVRFLLRLAFERDERFEVVGEAADGRQAVELAARCQPDLLVLDSNMPVMGGVEAIPHIRRASPRTAVLLYTAGVDRTTAQAAVAAGAVDVLEKMPPGPTMVDMVAHVLVDHWAGPDAAIHVEVGPVPQAAARVWLANTSRLVAAVRAHPELFAEPIPADVLDDFEGFLATWRSLAGEGEEFHWIARAKPADVRRLVTHWAALDRMTDEQLAALEVTWSPPEGTPFFEALVEGVLAALSAHDETQQLAVALTRQWATA
ncbi:MAG TPA: response regulator [Acidimicrobiales bacterium]